MSTAAIAGPSLYRRFAVGLLFGILVLAVLALAGDLRQVSSRVLQLPLGAFSARPGFHPLQLHPALCKWHYYLGQVGVRSLSLVESARLFVAGFPLAVTPGKVGEVFKGVWLNQATGLSVAQGVSVVVAERISDGLAVLVLSTAGVIAYPQYWPAFALLLLLLLSIVVVSQIRPLALALLRLGERLPVIKRIAHALTEFYEGSFPLLNPPPSPPSAWAPSPGWGKASASTSSCWAWVWRRAGKLFPSLSFLWRFPSSSAPHLPCLAAWEPPRPPSPAC